MLSHVMTHLTIYVLCFCHLTLITRIILWYITIFFPYGKHQRFTRNAQAPRAPSQGPRDPGHLERRWNCKTKRQVVSPKPPGARWMPWMDRRRFGKAMEKTMGDGWKMWKHCEKCGKMWKTCGKMWENVEQMWKTVETCRKYWDFINIKVDFWRNISEWK